MNLTEELIKKSIIEQKITWSNLKKNLNEELVKKEESVEEDNWNFVAHYILGRGIMLNKGLQDSEKIILSLHEFQHYVQRKSAAYMATDKEDVDKSAVDAISFLLNELKDDDETRVEIESLKESLYYEKLFKNA